MSDGLNFLYLNVFYLPAGNNSNTILYGRTTDDQVLIKRSMDEINKAFPRTFCSATPPTQLIIGTWINFKKNDTQQVSTIFLPNA